MTIETIETIACSCPRSARLHKQHYSIPPPLQSIAATNKQEAPLSYVPLFLAGAVMAPDLNGLPPSPRVNATISPQALTPSHPTTSSRRASQIHPMSPPPLPLSSPGGTIPTSQQHGTTSNATQPFPPFHRSNSSDRNVPGSFPTGSESPNVPVRHPRPLTAAELHLELEQEQEAVVRLHLQIPSLSP